MKRNPTSAHAKRASKQKKSQAASLRRKIDRASENIMDGLVVARRVRNTAWIDTMITDLKWLTIVAKKGKSVGRGGEKV